ncbi:hypothetical protein WMF39_28780 [Sorangium sp. So ce1504]|uniref:hypothetical protein n=1 Tax=Sorangium sp. So ce1504 TaxID=3133337 RepID=UPI003F6131DB
MRQTYWTGLAACAALSTALGCNAIWGIPDGEASGDPAAGGAGSSGSSGGAGATASAGSGAGGGGGVLPSRLFDGRKIRLCDGHHRAGSPLTAIAARRCAG